jgi:hypothetical protein
LTIHEVLRWAIETELIRESPPTPDSAAIIIAGDNGRVACVFATREFLEDSVTPEFALKNVLDLWLGRDEDAPEYPPVEDYE